MKPSLLVRSALAFTFLLLAACSAGPVRRINPPAVSIQQLSVQADGQWLVELRVQNFSTVEMTFASLEASLDIEGSNAGSVFVRPDVQIPAESAEVVTATVSAAAGASANLRGAARNGSIGYRLHGAIRSSDPDKQFDLDRSSRLSPVPGRPDTYR